MGDWPHLQNLEVCPKQVPSVSERQRDRDGRGPDHREEQISRKALVPVPVLPKLSWRFLQAGTCECVLARLDRWSQSEPVQVLMVEASAGLGASC